MVIVVVYSLAEVCHWRDEFPFGRYDLAIELFVRCAGEKVDQVGIRLVESRARLCGIVALPDSCGAVVNELEILTRYLHISRQDVTGQVQFKGSLYPAIPGSDVGHQVSGRPVSQRPW